MAAIQRVLICAFCVALSAGCSGARSLYDSITEADVRREKLKQRDIRRVVSSSLITEAFVTDRCGELSRGGFIWMQDQHSFSDWLAPLGSSQTEQVLARVPFDSHGALVVDFGALSTPGHSVKLLSNRLQIEADKAVVQVDIVRPAAAAGKRMPQQLTHPCSVLAVPLASYSMLEVQTGLGDVLTSFAVD